MTQGGKVLGQILNQVVAFAKPGHSLKDLDDLTEKLMLKSGGQPGFKLVPGYKWSTCINLNSGVVHGIPHQETKLKSQDLVSLDMGLFFKGNHTDTSTSFVVGKPSKIQQKFLKTGQLALNSAIAVAQIGNRVGHISQAYQKVIESSGYTCARNLTGHGIGKNLHMYPSVPCFLSSPIDSTPLLTEGMTLALEIIYMQGDWSTKKSSDNWTIETKDGKLAGLFEHTILLTKKGPKILTKA